MDPLSKDFLGMQYKATDAEFKADGDEGIFEGHFSIFGNVDEGGDIVEPGAFEKTIAENGHRVKTFFAHDWMKLIAGPLIQLLEDRKGLFAKGKLILESLWGKEAWVLMKAGALTEGSFGYRVIEDEVTALENGGSVRRLKELKLLEISPVPLGMNPQTSVAAVKQLLQQGLPLDQLQQTGLDPLDLLAKNLDSMAMLIEQRDLLITADPIKAKEAAGRLKSLSDGLLSVLAVGPVGNTDHATLKLKARSAELKLKEIEHIN